MSASNPESWPRLHDLISGITPAKFRKLWLQHFARATSTVATRGRFQEIEATLAHLSDGAWATLKQSVLGQIHLRNPNQGWLQALDRLAEARAYHCLVERGCTDIEFVTASVAEKTPDLHAFLGGAHIFCEVKVIKITSAGPLSQIFFKKLATRLAEAIAQLRSVPNNEATHLLVYVALCFAEISSDLIEIYTQQAQVFAENFLPRDVEIVFDAPYEARFVNESSA